VLQRCQQRRDGRLAETAHPFGQVADPRRLVYCGAGHIPCASRPDDDAATDLACVSRGPMF
jgi:hypothetical protein